MKPYYAKHAKKEKCTKLEPKNIPKEQSNHFGNVKTAQMDDGFQITYQINGDLKMMTIDEGYTPEDRIWFSNRYPNKINTDGLFLKDESPNTI